MDSVLVDYGKERQPHGAVWELHLRRRTGSLGALDFEPGGPATLNLGGRLQSSETSGFWDFKPFNL